MTPHHWCPKCQDWANEVTRVCVDGIIGVPQCKRCNTEVLWKIPARDRAHALRMQVAGALLMISNKLTRWAEKIGR